jgi:hypothetical protein
MKLPVRCPHGCGYTLAWDLSLAHQHIKCHECLCEFCGVCVGFVTIHADEDFQEQNQDPRRAAHLN